MNALVRFFRYAPMTDSDSCWSWTGGTNRGGYGNFSFGGQTVSAHRWILEWFTGERAAGDVDHICRNRACVNPEHLRVVTERQNVLENSASFVAANVRKTQCPEGHEYSEANTRWKGNRRLCRACGRIQRQAYRSTAEYRAQHAAYERRRRAART